MNLVDQSSRQAALDTSHSFVVTAPAGSGKTGLLTFRVLKLLAQVKAPEEIVAITFTKKAAKEMQERIVCALSDAEAATNGLSYDQAMSKINEIENSFEKTSLLLGYKALENTKKQGCNIIENAHRLKIKTIDSFCRELAVAMPINSGLDSSINIATPARHLYQEAVQQFIKDYSNGHYLEPTNALIKHFDGNLDKLYEQLVDMLAKRDQWLPLLTQMRTHDAPINEILNESLESLALEKTRELSEIMNPFAPALLELTRFSATNLSHSDPQNLTTLLIDTYEIPAPSKKSISQFWQPLCEALFKKTGTFKQSVNVKNGFPANEKDKKSAFIALIKELESIEGLQDKLEDIKIFPSKGYSTKQVHIMNALMQVLPLCVAYLQITFTKLKEIDFTETMLSALRALGSIDDEPTDLSFILDYTLNHILIDEFQDTSYSQLQLLELLTQIWSPEDNRTLFVVGDGMQSCYRFRNANVGIFLNIRDNGLSNVPVVSESLSVNFRSNKSIISWVNKIFTDAFPSKNDINVGAVAYEPSFAFSDNQSDDSIQCVGFSYCKPDENTQINTRKLQSRDQAKQCLYESISHQINEIHSKDNKETIAIIARTKTQLAQLIEVLKSHSIAYRAVEIDSLISRSEIQDLITLTSLLYDPSNHNTWLSILRSPWCALSFEQLSILAGEHILKTDAPIEPIYLRIKNDSVLHALDDDARNRVIRLRDIIQKAFEHTRRVPLSCAVEQCWYALGGALYLSNATQLDNIQTYFSLLARHEYGSAIKSWNRFLDELTQLFASGQPKVNSDERPAVELMTMHKSKGLEFDNVFLIGLDSQMRNDDKTLMSWAQFLDDNNHLHTLLSPLKAHAEEHDSELSQFIAKHHKKSAQYEEVRLLYVACTRAKKRLFLQATFENKLNKKTNELELKPPASNTLLGKIWDQLSDDFTFVDVNKYHTANQAEYNTSNTNHLTARIKSHHLNDQQLYGKLNTHYQFLKQLQPVFEPEDKDNQYVEGDRKSDYSSSFDNSNIALFEQPSTHTEHVATVFGTLLHRLLHQICIDSIDLWPQSRLEATSNHWQNILINEGLTDQQAQDVFKRVTKAINMLRDDDTFKWLMNHSHEQSACEWEIYYGRPVKKIIIDRFFVEDQTAWIIDYKSSAPAKGISHEDFLLSQQALYAKQLNQYKSVLTDKLPSNISIKTALYFPVVNLLHVFEDETHLI